MRTTSRSLFIISAVLTLCTGCGYTTSSTLPKHLNTIHVEPIDNEVVYTSASSRNVYFPLIEVDARNAIIERFQFDGNLQIANRSSADLVLKGKLLNYDRQGLRFSEDDVAEEYRIHVVCSFEMWDMTEGEILWREPRFVGEATFFISGPQVSSEESAVDEALDDLARRIVERTVEDW